MLHPIENSTKKSAWINLRVVDALPPSTLVVIVFSLLFLLLEDVADAIVDVRAQGQREVRQTVAQRIEEVLRPQQEVSPEDELDQDSDEAASQSKCGKNHEDHHDANHCKRNIDKNRTDEIHEPGKVLSGVHRPAVELCVSVNVVRFRVGDGIFVDDLNHSRVVDFNNTNISACLTVREGFVTGKEGGEGGHSFFL